MKKGKNTKKLLLSFTFLFFLFSLNSIAAWNFDNVDDDFNFIEKEVVITLDNLVKYIEVYGNDVGDIALDQNVYTNVTNITEGLNNGFNVTNGTISNLNSGVYQVVSQWAFSGGANTEYHLSLSLNGVTQMNCHTERVIGSGGDVGSSSYTCIIRLTVGDWVIPIVENVDSGVNPTIHDIQINLVKIGD